MRLAIMGRVYRAIGHLNGDEHLQELWDIPRYLTADQAAQLRALDRHYRESAEPVAAKAVSAYQHRLRPAPELRARSPGSLLLQVFGGGAVLGVQLQGFGVVLGS